MMLSCSCDFYEDEDTWYFDSSESDFYESAKPCKCAPCGCKIEARALFWSFPRFKIDDEGEEEYISPVIACEKCGDLMATLLAFGYCFNPYEPIQDAWRQYIKDGYLEA